MRIEKLKERLKEIDAPVSEKTLRRWGKNGLIKDHEPRPNLPGIGRGNAEEWDEQALQDAAAVWAVSNCGIMKPRALNKKISLGIKEIAHRVFTSPTVMHELPSDITITTPNPSYVYDFRSLKTKLDHNDTVNDLAVAWITAKAKVQNNEKVREEARRIKELEDAQSDEWKREKRRLKNLGAGSFPRYVFFKISDPAKVIVHWHSVLLRIKNPLLKTCIQMNLNAHWRRKAYLKTFHRKNGIVSFCIFLTYFATFLSGFKGRSVVSFRIPRQ